MRKFIISLTSIATLTLAGVPVLGVAQAAHAAPVKVAVGDIDLARAGHAEVLQARTEAAVAQFCADRSQPQRLDLNARRACAAGVRAEIAEKFADRQRMASAAPIAVAVR